MMLLRRAAPHPAEQVLDDADYGSTVKTLNDLHALHGEAAMGRLKQFLTIVRSSRAGLEVRDDHADPGLKSVEDGVDLKVKVAVPVLATLAWLWRYLEGEFDSTHGREPLDENRARWTKRPRGARFRRPSLRRASRKS